VFYSYYPHLIIEEVHSCPFRIPSSMLVEVHCFTEFIVILDNSASGGGFLSAGSAYEKPCRSGWISRKMGCIIPYIPA